MSSLNRVILIGRVVAAPESRFTNTGKQVASFRIAVDRRQRNADGSSNADFIPIVAWEKLADICVKYLTKGKLVAIEGRLQTRTYEGQDGQKRSAFDVVADDMRMLSRNENGGGYSRPQDSGSDYGSARPQAPAGDFDNIDMDDVPF